MPNRRVNHVVIFLNLTVCRLILYLILYLLYLSNLLCPHLLVLLLCYLCNIPELFLIISDLSLFFLIYSLYFITKLTYH